MIAPHRAEAQRGSAMIMAVFVLFLLASTGTALLFLSNSEVRMSQAATRTSQVFYIAESAVEAGRQRLYDLNGLDGFSDDLATAAGPDGVISIDPDAIEPIYNGAGQLTGVTGIGDDRPLVALQGAGDGLIAAFLMNDPLEGRANQTDTNDRVMIVGFGAGAGRSFEVVEAIVERRPPIPLIPPATITLLGKPPEFYSATSKVKDYLGEDCGGSGGVPGLYAPVVGAIGSDGVDAAEKGIEPNPDYVSGPLTDADVFADLTDPSEPTVVSGVGTIDPAWNDCATLNALVDDLRDRADYICRGKCEFPDYGPDTLIFIEGDYSMEPTQSGQGILVCTGELTMLGRTSWSGLVLVIGEGVYRLNGAGKGIVSGGMMIADIAGDDNVYGTADDCTSGSDGLGVGVFDERGGGNAATVYCSTALTTTNVRPYEVVEFLQH